MTFTSDANRIRCESPYGFNHTLQSWSSNDWSVAFLGELGEAANILKKLNRSRDGVPGNKVDDGVLKKSLAEEIADAVIYFDLFAQSLGVRAPWDNHLKTPVTFMGKIGLSARMMEIFREFFELTIRYQMRDELRELRVFAACEFFAIEAGFRLSEVCDFVFDRKSHEIKYKVDWL